jgi:hypothetical protein
MPNWNGAIDWTSTLPTGSSQTAVVGWRNVPSGGWVAMPSIFRLRLIGTGMVTIDSRDRLGTVTTGVETFSASGATNQIEFPFLGDAATEMRATFPSTLTVEVLS